MQSLNKSDIKATSIITPLPDPKAVHVADSHFSCTSCGECCRRWHVHTPPEEKRRLEALAWAPEDQLPKTITTHIAGHDYLAHTDNGACIFLEQSTNMCRIHGRFGYDAKPLGCKVYPYNIVSTFPGRYSVLGRFDCPAIRANHGPPLRQDLPAIRHFIQRMHFKSGFDAEILDGLLEGTITTINEALFHQLLDRHALSTPARFTGAVLAARRLEHLGAAFLNNSDAPLAKLIPSLFERVRQDQAALTPRRLTRFEAARFLGLLSAYLRRDEEMIGRGLGARLTRTLAMAGMLFGHVNPRHLGAEHPNARLTSRLLFTRPVDDSGLDWKPYYDLLRVRLQAYQYFGPANYNLSLFTGLRSLFFTFPLVLATAKWAALARDPDRCQLTADDLDYAIGAIDHSFGRSALLQMGMCTVLTQQLTEPATYHRLVWHLWNGQGK